MIILNNDEQKLNFYKNRILEKLELIRNDMSPEKYKYFTSMVLECDRYEELREMSEMDMQIEFINYTRKEIIDKLAEHGLTIDDAKRMQEERNNAADLQLITPARKKAHPDMFALDNNEVGEAIYDEEMLEAAASILFARLQNEPLEEKYSEIIDNINDAGNISDELDRELDSLLDTEDDSDDYDPLDEIDEWEEDEYTEDEDEDLEEDLDDSVDTTDKSDYDPLDEIDDFENEEEDDYDPLDELDDYDMGDDDWEEDEYYNEENALDSISESDKAKLEDIKNKFIVDDEDDEDIEFGYDITKEKKEEPNKIYDPLDELDDELEEDDYDPLDALDDKLDEDYDPLDDLDDKLDEDYDPLDELDDEEDDYDPLDDLDDGDWDDENDYDPLDDLDDEDDEDDNSDDNSSYHDPLDEIDDESDDFLDIDNIDADELFTPDLKDPLDELDDWEDIDSEYEEKSDKETGDDLDKFIQDRNNKSTASNPEPKRILKQDKIFLNGTKRGEETQKMYNLVNSILNKSSKIISNTSKQVANKSKRGISRLSQSEFLS